MSDSPMSRRRMLQAATILGAAGAMGSCAPDTADAAPRAGKTTPLTAEEMAAIDSAMGKKGAYNEGQATYTVALPRNDLKMRIKGDNIPIAFGFGGWVSVKRALDGRSAVLMSDTVLLQEEVNGLISAAQESGLEVSAIHNHFFYEEPRIFFMHIHGMGAPADLIGRYAAAVRTTKLFPANQPAGGPAPSRTGKEIFDVAGLDEIVKYKAAVNGPTIKYTIGRDDLHVVAMNAHMTAAIGLNSWAAFAGDREDAHIAGDIAMLDPEVNPVIRALRKNDLEVVAVHSHMLGEQPRIIFLHYYGSGPASTLARGFRAALDELGRHGRTIRMAGMRMGA
ncbi:MAG TPA: DUF1259 domain-containing protein [Chthonomonadaceae bacterium]|nr:DUF1259 domain-containing protein [Chthonomonadaceae bacterium]